MADVLECVEVESGSQPQMTVIWLHGLGADGHDFEPIVPQLVGPDQRAVRFVFPHAPVRPVTLNNGYPMRAWYDIVGIDRSSPQDEAGVRASDAAIQVLIKREKARGVATDRIVIAGFSQGGAMALYSGLRYPEKLGGIIGLSCYLVMTDTLDRERQAVNQTTPIFMAHGLQDPVVAFKLGDDSRALLQARGYPLEWHSYPMPHSVCPEEIAAIAQWLRNV